MSAPDVFDSGFIDSQPPPQTPTVPPGSTTAAAVTFVDTAKPALVASQLQQALDAVKSTMRYQCYVDPNAPATHGNVFKTFAEMVAFRTTIPTSPIDVVIVGSVVTGAVGVVNFLGTLQGATPGVSALTISDGATLQNVIWNFGVNVTWDAGGSKTGGLTPYQVTADPHGKFIMGISDGGSINVNLIMPQAETWIIYAAMHSDISGRIDVFADGTSHVGIGLYDGATIEPNIVFGTQGLLDIHGADWKCVLGTQVSSFTGTINNHPADCSTLSYTDTLQAPTVGETTAQGIIDVLKLAAFPGWALGNGVSTPLQGTPMGLERDSISGIISLFPNDVGAGGSRKQVAGLVMFATSTYAYLAPQGSIVPTDDSVWASGTPPQTTDGGKVVYAAGTAGTLTFAKPMLGPYQIVGLVAWGGLGASSVLVQIGAFTP